MLQAFGLIRECRLFPDLTIYFRFKLGLPGDDSRGIGLEEREVDPAYFAKQRPVRYGL